MTRSSLSSRVTIRYHARLSSKLYYISIIILIALLIGINVLFPGDHLDGFSTEVFCAVFLSLLLITCVSVFRIQVRRYQNFLVFDKDVDPSLMAYCCCDSNPESPDCCSCCNSCCQYLPINLQRRRFNNSICCDGCCNCCIDCCIECAGERIKSLPPGLSQNDIVFIANHRVIYYPRASIEKEMVQNRDIGSVIPAEPAMVVPDQDILPMLSPQPVKCVQVEKPIQSMGSMKPKEPMEPMESIESIESMEPVQPPSPPTPPTPIHPPTLLQQSQPVYTSFLPVSFPETQDPPSVPPPTHPSCPPDDSQP